MGFLREPKTGAVIVFLFYFFLFLSFFLWQYIQLYVHNIVLNNYNIKLIWRLSFIIL